MCMTTTMCSTSIATVTEFAVMYRDGDNYKRHATITVGGEFTAEQIVSLRATLDQGEFYAPKNVGLPHLLDESDWSAGDADHCWHELDLDAAAEVRPARDGELLDFNTPAAMIAKFAKASTAGWRDQLAKRWR